MSALYLFCVLMVSALGLLASSTTRTTRTTTTSSSGVVVSATTRQLEEGSANEASLHSGARGSTGLKFEEELSLIDLRVIISISLILILLTVSFEMMKESLEESVSEDYAIILEKFFGELTILGFLSMVTFLISKTGTLEKMSEHLFEGKGEELLEYVE